MLSGTLARLYSLMHINLKAYIFQLSDLSLIYLSTIMTIVIFFVFYTQYIAINN